MVKDRRCEGPLKGISLTQGEKHRALMYSEKSMRTYVSERTFSLIVALLCCILMPSGAISATGPIVGGCPLFLADNIWNTEIDALPADANSSAYISAIGSSTGLHPDFGSGSWDGGPIGIPYNIVPGTQEKVAITFTYADESDPGPYPIPPDALIEGGSGSAGDRHVLVLDKDACILYETWSTYPQPDGTWQAGSGAVFDLRSDALRPSGWTSADAAGLPILPGLVRYDEVASGEIRHAIRFTAPRIRKAYVWPARHYAGSITVANDPPMGQRFRLRAGFDIAAFSSDVQVILNAMKKYGIILADIGSAWYISGVPDPGWNNDLLVSEFNRVHGSDFEAVDESSLTVNPDSAEACSQPAALIGSIPYDSVAAAYSAVGSYSAPATVKVLGTNLTESLDFDAGYNAILQGGYDCGFANRLLYSILRGSLTLGSGTTELDGIEIE